MIKIVLLRIMIVFREDNRILLLERHYKVQMEYMIQVVLIIVLRVMGMLLLLKVDINMINKNWKVYINN